MMMMIGSDIDDNAYNNDNAKTSRYLNHDDACLSSSDHIQAYGVYHLFPLLL